jgi:hypothetical protein
MRLAVGGICIHLEFIDNVTRLRCRYTVYEAQDSSTEERDELKYTPSEHPTYSR